MSRTLHTSAVACFHLVALTPKSPVDCPMPAAHMGASGHEFGVSAVSPGNEACCLQSCSPPNLAVWLRDLDMLPQTPQETGPVPSPQAPGHFLGGQSHQPGATLPFQHASMKAQLRWTGHVTRMEDSRLPKQICSELAHGTRRQGARQSATKTP